MIAVLSFTIVLSVSYYGLAKLADYCFRIEAEKQKDNFWSFVPPVYQWNKFYQKFPVLFPIFLTRPRLWPENGSELQAVGWPLAPYFRRR